MFLNIPVIFYRLDYGDNLLGKLDKFDMEEIKAKDNQIFNVFYEEREVIDKIVQYRDNNFILEDDNLEIENSFFSEKKNLCEKFTKALENYKVFEVDDTSIEPKWKDVKNALCVSCSNEYLPYLSVYLKSVVENSHQNKDIIVFERDISNENKKRIINYFTNSNTSIRFVNPTSLFKNVNLYVSHDYFKEECYYRCAAPKLLNKYDKIIFTDLDLIVMDDIFKLADIDIKGHPIAACIEPIWQELYMQNNKIYNREIRAYTNNVLKLSSPFQYYNTGVLIFDVKEYNKLNSFEKLLDIINNNKLLYQEQCAFNILFKDNFFTLPNVWNYELAPSLVNNTYHFEFYTKYKEVENEAKILHYLGRYKPWKNPFEYKASIWWSYARQTPFYEEILSNMINHNNASVTARLNASISQLRKELTQLHFPNINKHFAANESTIARANANISQLRKEFTQLHFPNINNHFAANEREMKLLFVMNHLFSFKLKKYYYGFNKAFSFGKRHQRYQQKFDLVKNLIKDAKLYKRSFFKV